jgi:hypothetical protein
MYLVPVRYIGQLESCLLVRLLVRSTFDTSHLSSTARHWWQDDNLVVSTSSDHITNKWFRLIMCTRWAYCFSELCLTRLQIISLKLNTMKELFNAAAVIAQLSEPLLPSVPYTFKTEVTTIKPVGGEGCRNFTYSTSSCFHACNSFLD